MNVAVVRNLNDTINYLKENDVWIYATDMLAKNNYNEEKYDSGVGIVIGNEGKGIGQLIRKRCDFLTKLPMKGKVSSLNASNACAILVYEALRQRDEN